MQTLSLKNDSAIVSIDVDSSDFKHIFKENPTYNDKSVRVIQTERISDILILVEIDFIQGGKQ